MEARSSTVQRAIAARAGRTAYLVCLLAVLGAFRVGGAYGQEAESGLRGVYAVTIAAEDVPPELIEGASLIGRWRMTFGDDGAYVFGRQDVGDLVHGRFEVDGNRVTLLDETGVIACEAGPDGATATYTWEMTEDRLLLSAIAEPCDRRRLLLTTRVLSPFAPCPPLNADEPDPHRGSLPGGQDAALAASPVGDEPLAPALPAADIDMLLKQMSDCWATRQPERFLQLLSEQQRAAQIPEDDDAERRFILNMGAPIVWDLASEVEVVDGDRATAMVRQTLGDTIDEVRYAFVFEDGRWRWDGVADAP
jgi:hypothetical protein